MNYKKKSDRKSLNCQSSRRVILREMLPKRCSKSKKNLEESKLKLIDSRQKMMSFKEV
jgi:hypothetical protein